MSTAAATELERVLLHAEDIQRIFRRADPRDTRNFVRRRGLPAMWDGKTFYARADVVGVWLVEQMPAPARPVRFDPLEQAAHDRALDLIRDAIAREYLQIGPKANAA